MNINETSEPIKIDGEKRGKDRARIITIYNGSNENKSIEFINERLITTPLGEQHEPKANTKVFFDLSTDYTLYMEISEKEDIEIDKDTFWNLPKHVQLQVLLYSLWKYEYYEKNK